MSYEKRVVILKEVGGGFSTGGVPLSGAVYAERIDGRLSLHIKTTALAPLKEGKYVAVFSSCGISYCAYLPDDAPLIIENAPSLKEGFSLLIAFLRGEGQPVAFGFCGRGQSDYRVLLRALTHGEIKKHTAKGKGVNADADPFSAALEELNGAAGEGLFDGVLARHGNETDAGARAQGGREEESHKHSQTHGGAIHPFYRAQNGLAYYQKMRERLSAVFEKYPKDERLNKIFPSSQWVRAEQALIGVVYQESMPRYLCLAVQKKGPPPAHFRGQACFVPAASGEEGYYVLFHDADTGAAVKVYGEDL